MTGINEILATTDLSETAGVGLEEAADLARRLDARLTVLYVTQDELPPIIPGMDNAERVRILERHAEHARSRLERELQKLGPDLDSKSVVVIGRPAVEIARYARDEDIDLVVMASHGYGFLGQALLGSTTSGVLHRTACRVLVVPADRDA